MIENTQLKTWRVLCVLIAILFALRIVQAIVLNHTPAAEVENF